jgi:hypothetical protein
MRNHMSLSPGHTWTKLSLNYSRSSGCAILIIAWEALCARSAIQQSDVLCSDLFQQHEFLRDAYGCSLAHSSYKRVPRGCMHIPSKAMPFPTVKVLGRSFDGAAEVSMPPNNWAFLRKSSNVTTKLHGSELLCDLYEHNGKQVTWSHNKLQDCYLFGLLVRPSSYYSAIQTNLLSSNLAYEVPGC